MRTHPGRIATAATALASLVLGLLVVAPAVATADPPQPATVAPVVSYSFDGDPGDSSGNGHDGTWSGSESYATGVAGLAAHTSAANYVTVPLTTATNASGSFAVSGWVQVNSTANSAVILSDQDAHSCADKGVSLIVQSNGQTGIGICWGDGSVRTRYDQIASTSLLGAWHHLALVYDASARDLSFYLDGARTWNHTGTVTGSGLPWHIGRDAGTWGVAPDALVDDFRYYDQTVSAGQVAADYAATTPYRGPGDTVAPVVSYNFDGDAADRGAHRYHGTWTGTAGYGAGVSGQAAHTSLSNYVTLPLNSDTDASGSFTYSAWTYITSAAASSVLISDQKVDSCGHPGLSLIVQSRGLPGAGLCWDNTGTNTRFDQVTTTSLLGGWHYLALAYDATAGSLAFYLDGAQTWTHAAALTGSGLPWVVGRDAGAWNVAPDALVDDFDYYDVAVPAAQILNDYNATRGHAVTVSDDGHGAGTASPASAFPGTTVALSAAPDPGYHFTGWQPRLPAGLTLDGDTFAMPAADVTVQSTFAPNSYTVHYDANGASGTVGDSAFTYDLPAVLAENSFVRQGYAFTGWNTEPDGSGTGYTDGQSVRNLTTAAGGSVTLYAQWARADGHLITVTSGGHGTAVSSPRSAEEGTVVSLTATADPGYHLTGWQATSPADLTISPDGTFTMPDAEVSIEAAFAANHYRVVFDGNGADDGSMAAASYTYDQASALPAVTFARAGYVFSGWATTAGGGVAYTDGQSVTGLGALDDGATVTLYAVWAPYAYHRAPADATAPVVSYDFDGKTTDQTGNGNDAAWTGTAAYSAGVAHQAAHTDVTDYLTVPLNAATNASGSFSYAAWVHVNSSANSAVLIGNQAASSCANPGVSLIVQSGGATGTGICWGYNGTRYRYDQISSTSLIGGWHHVALVYDAAAKTLTYYVDGAKAWSQSGQMTNSGLPWFIGRDGGTWDATNAPIDALVDDFDYYDAAVPGAQILNDYNATNPATQHTLSVTSTGHGTATAPGETAGAGQPVTLSATPEAGYHLAEWTVVSPSGLTLTGNTFTMPASDVTVQAVFAPNTYTVHYDANGGTGEMQDSPHTYGDAAPLSENAFTNDGYVFRGWARTPTGAPQYADGQPVSDLTTAGGTTVTLYAAWARPGSHVVTVTVNGHAAATVSPWAAPPGETVTVGITPDTGYHRAGWQTDPSSVEIAADGTFTMPDEDVSIEARIAVNTYTVRFDGNGADTGSTATQTLTYGVSAALSANGFGRDGYAFTSWNTAADGSGTSYANAAIVQNLTADEAATVTLYAQWRAVTMTPGTWASLPAGFVSDTLRLPGVCAGDAIAQPLLGLWNGAAPTSFAKTGGDDWLSVSATGVVTGDAPADVPQHPGAISVRATKGSVSSEILVDIPVVAATDSPQIQAASWNLWDAGAHVTDALGKDLAVIAAQGLNVIGVQEDNGSTAQELAAELGWHSYQFGDLGIVSAWPIDRSAAVAPTADVPATAVALDVHGQPVRVWDVYLDESQGTSAQVEQAQSVAAAVRPDVAAAGTTPVLVLGDLSSAAAELSAAGLTDASLAAASDAAAGSATTWPIFGSGTADRVDYVWFAGSALNPTVADNLTVGWPSGTDPAANSWTSDHAAVDATFTLGTVTETPAPALPVVSTAHPVVAYQVGHGPADDAALLSAIGAGSDIPGAAMAVDRGTLDLDTAGWYTVLVTATSHGLTSDPVAVTVRVAPLVAVTLAQDSATFTGSNLSEPALLTHLGAALNVHGQVSADLSAIPAGIPGSYPVTVVGTDVWGFSASADATVVVEAVDLPVTVTTAGQGTAGASARTANPGDTVTLTASAATGYSFEGWQVTAPADLEITAGSGAGSSTFVMPSQGVTLKAVFTPITFAIGYDLAGGQAVSGNPTSYTVDSDPITLANPTRTGYVFAGWTGTGLDTATPEVTIAAGSTGDRAYTATWSPITYTVHFDPNAPGATGATPDETLTYDLPQLLHAVGFLRGGHAFAGWATTAGGPVAYHDAANVSNLSATAGATVTLYTVWTVPTLQIPGGALVPGSAARLSGAEFTPYEQVRLTAQPGPVVLATASADGSGAFAVTVTVPAALAPGQVQIAALGLSSATTVTRTTTAGPAWAATSTYNTGNYVTYDGSLWLARWWTQNQKPGDPTGPWEEIRVTADGQAVWTASRVFDAGDTALYNGSSWKALWWTRNQTPGDVTGPWQQLLANPDGTAIWTATRQFASGDTVTYHGVRYVATAASRAVTPGAVNTGWAWKPAS